MSEPQLSELSLGTILKAALIAGLAAGLTVAIFHAVATEPLIDRAIALEQEQEEAGGQHEQPIVSRQAQKGGLFVGFVLYGLVWSSLLGVVYHAARRWLPARDGRGQRLLLALAAYWAIGLFPLLKYPANPPGVGDPETIGYRQLLYVAALALSALGTAVALALARRPLGGVGWRSQGRRWAQALGFLAVFSAILFVLLPANPDAVEMPLGLVVRFRLLSALGLTLFWAVLGVLFALLLRSGPRERIPSGAAG